jgi:hypothetical protein
MELLFRSIARAGGIEVPAEVQIFTPPKRKPQQDHLSTKTAKALHRLARVFDRLADRLAAHAGPAGGRPVAPERGIFRRVYQPRPTPASTVI